MISEVAKHLHSYFATSQTYYAEQQSDGSYRKRPGSVTPIFLSRNINNGGSIAIYQKNLDNTLKWVCLDFDILKKHVNKETFELAHKELGRVVTYFCHSLAKLEIPYLLEFSGNRGYHIWITFEESVNFRVGYEVVKAIIDTIECPINRDYVAIDLFPANGSPAGGVGKCVKMPLSKHAKSGNYSLLIHEVGDVKDYQISAIKDEETLKKQIDILTAHQNISKSKIEARLGHFFELSQDETFRSPRVRLIKVEKQGFSLDILLQHWMAHKPLKSFAEGILAGRNLNNEERKLLVGMFANIECKNKPSLNKNILHKIFEKTPNYKVETTNNAIKALSSFYFPSQEQIEKTIGVQFGLEMDTTELIKVCIPRYIEHKDATLDLSAIDVDIARRAEINYALINDEVNVKSIMTALSTIDKEELLVAVKEFVGSTQKSKFYVHERNEGDKVRSLTTLSAIDRVALSSILKQILYLLDYIPNQNSFGYRPNHGFKDGYIFQPWLNLWIKFINNISLTIEERDNANFFIVKADIEKFYDSIPHDNLKRLLLGGVNPSINVKVGKLSTEIRERYITYLDKLFQVNEDIVGSNIGLPQGPAFARFMAEIYLDNIDTWLTSEIGTGRLLLYQRYVDDIFFIAPSKEVAMSLLAELELNLGLLGLKLNTKKTIVSQIGNFSADFEAYRSQSKYAVDKVTKSNFVEATETQQNLAINEFLKLVQADTCNDDLAFIFSHLNGVPQLDRWKRSKVLPTLQSQIGRGTLYKHLFNFVLEDPQNWDLLDAAPKFSKLQSEVLTACFIYALENNKFDSDNLITLLGTIIPKLERTDVVNEHLAHMKLIHNISMELSDISPKDFITCIVNHNEMDNFIINADIIDYLNTAINDIDSTELFTKILYPLCTLHSLPKTSLNKLAYTFYAKMASDHINNKLETNPIPEIKSLSTAEKFYYLLCLFSISDKNPSTELMKSMWKYCTNLFNLYGDERPFKTPHEWFKKIKDIDIDQRKALLIVTSIVDGTIARGVTDKFRIFERFHNNILIFVTFQNFDWLREDIDEVLFKLRNKGVFYQWLTEREHIRIFPYNNKNWFERNLTDNGLIMLKKGNEVLIRRPTEHFHNTNSPQNAHNGYSEIIEQYHPETLQSLKEQIIGKSIKEIFNSLGTILNATTQYVEIPNIFVGEKLLKETSLVPFTKELLITQYLILEDHDDSVHSFPTNILNFVRCLFRTVGNQYPGSYSKIFYEKYLLNIGKDIEIVEFLKHLNAQINEITVVENAQFFDLVIAAALHLSLHHYDSIIKVDKFVNQYHLFNKQAEDRHIYGVCISHPPSDDTPVKLFSSVEHSLSVIRSEGMNSLTFYLDKDVSDYVMQFNRLTERIEAQDIDPGVFSKATVKIQHIKEMININGVEFKYEDIFILNPASNDVEQFEPRMTTFLNSAEHVYFVSSGDKAYAYAVHNAISKMYSSIVQRYKNIVNSHSERSYHLPYVDKGITSLDGFYSAVNVIAAHRDISIEDAQSTFIRWLQFLPQIFHSSFVSLISAHVYMTKSDIDTFINCVETLLIDKTTNPFLIKRINDYNGTHRVLYKKNEIGRNVDYFSPHNISKNANSATIVVDNIITGSQITDAIKYYVGVEEKDPTANYFSYDEEVARKLKNLSEIRICTIFYTSQALSQLEVFLRQILNPSISVSVVNGRDLGGDAFFGQTSRLGEDDKVKIRSLLKDEQAMSLLHNVLAINKGPKKKVYYSDQEIDGSNLVARYQSLPKKCFKFLHSGLKHDKRCHPLVRVFEIGENA